MILQMLSNRPIKKASMWPQLKKDETPQPKLINVTGSQTKPINIISAKKKDSESEPEDYIPAPSFNRSFGDAIAVALEKATHTATGCKFRFSITKKLLITYFIV